MTFLESLKVSLNGFGVVMLVLLVLSILVMLQSMLVKVFEKKPLATQSGAITQTIVTDDIQVSSVSGGQLNLIEVDEKTAAMVMAIVSDQSEIPLSELVFKSIKAVD